jgi:hypothetical protein
MYEVKNEKNEVFLKTENFQEAIDECNRLTNESGRKINFVVDKITTVHCGLYIGEVYKEE